MKGDKTINGRQPEGQTYTIHGASDNMVTDTGTILGSAATDQNDVMLHDIVAHAWDVGTDDAA